ncbi:MAG: AraC family transcriptional regulator, partial [Bacteroidota bacterium]
QLKKGFKTLFGNTVFGYWHVQKMDYARNLLLDDAITVADVAEQVGYKNPQHFSTAFKRHYGVSPGKVKA